MLEGKNRLILIIEDEFNLADVIASRLKKKNIRI